MKGNFPPAGSVVLAKPLSEGLTDLALDKLDRTLIKQLRLLDITIHDRSLGFHTAHFVRGAPPSLSQDG